jgi:hypothetical protein
MILRYGSYNSDSNECSVVISRDAVMNDAGQPYALRHTWNINGTIFGDDTSAVVTALLALERAFAVWGLDLSLLDSSGNVCHSMPSTGSLTGVKIIRPPSYPQGDGAELSTFRNYEIIATCDYPYGLGQVTNPLKSFVETLAFSGGGPRRMVVECAAGPPQPQVLNQFTAFRATQTGSAVGMFGYPPIPPPIFPAALVENGQPTFTGGQLRGGVYVDFGVSWNYRFESASPLAGFPNQWPASG